MLLYTLLIEQYHCSKKMGVVRTPRLIFYTLTKNGSMVGFRGDDFQIFVHSACFSAALSNRSTLFRVLFLSIVFPNVFPKKQTITIIPRHVDHGRMQEGRKTQKEEYLRGQDILKNRHYTEECHSESIGSISTNKDANGKI